jgi:hypothetical protein
MCSLYKYIQEKGVIALIQSYAKYKIEEIYSIINTKLLNIYIFFNNRQTTFDDVILICALTNQSFIIIKYFYRKRVARIFEKRINLKFEQIFKMSFELSMNQFMIKYKYEIKSYKKTVYSRADLCNIVQKYNIKYYNIKILFRPSDKIYYSHTPKFIDKMKPYILYMQPQYNIYKAYNIKTFFPEEVQILIKTYNERSCDINIHNLLQ